MCSHSCPQWVTFLWCFYLLYVCFFFFLMIRRPPRSTHCISSAASDVYKRQAKADLTHLIARLSGERDRDLSGRPGKSCQAGASPARGGRFRPGGYPELGLA
eukprot:TRINITY_DN4971_c0_g1_i1.p5 TRINITY_DN4971_c0_g1~~TRINITY_DN4971_c0_g1_i1.p5  ORF type:complete len:102 (+),score=16.63 TRINITY_DN4971_c0_g1_i1:64-369(+)